MSGEACEAFVRGHFPYWESLGWLPYQNFKAPHNRIGEAFDFTIIKPSPCILIECKETEKMEFKFYTKAYQQLNNLLITEKCGHKAFFCVMYDSKGKQIVELYPVKIIKDKAKLEPFKYGLDKSALRDII